MNATELVFKASRRYWYALDGKQYGPFRNRLSAELAAFRVLDE